MDDLWKEFEEVKETPVLLDSFHKKISSLKFLDPACGCGNFLIIAYRELCNLEYELLRYTKEHNNFKVSINQFYGIEIEESSALLAQLGLQMVQYLMNRKFDKDWMISIDDEANIVCGNALTMDWNEVVPASELSYILGNPPFLGSNIMNKKQKQEILNIVGKASIDYVVAWYYKAAEYIQNTKIKVAFVSTNSICQGAQIEPIWKRLIEEYKIIINFAYRSFKWNNEAKGNAIVHCVIIGFSLLNPSNKVIYDGDNVTRARNISPYLWDAPNVFLKNRATPICNVPEMNYGNMPNDGGYFIFTQEEKDKFIKEEPKSERFFKVFQGADDYIHGNVRYCLWLSDITSIDIKDCPKIKERINLVKETRLKSTSATTREKAKTPHKFCYISHPDSKYLLIPLTSSEKRDYIPIGFCSSDIVASNAASVIASASLYHFGILTSSVHMLWMKLVAGRLELRYRYSCGIVYNNFPWVEGISDTQRKKIEQCAQAVLDARANHPQETLAMMYSDMMPDDLRKAHNNLDREVMKLYGYSNNITEDEIIVDLLNRYEKLTQQTNKTIDMFF